MQRALMLRRFHLRGFTLIELIVVVMLTGIIGATLATFIVPLVKGFTAQTQRAALVDAAETALRRMTRDIRLAVPNSVRIATTGSGYAIEMVPTVDGGRYCASGLADCTAAQAIDFTVADS